MICPNYKLKAVFNGFNEMVTAFGGKPMTEEEFRDPALRKQRKGSDYSAMEAAYKVYNRNGGNFLDYTPNGKESILFKSLYFKSTSPLYFSYGAIASNLFIISTAVL